MGKKIHRTPPEVKADILRRIKEEGITVAQASKDHGIHETTIYNWIGAGAQGAPSWSEFIKLQKQNRERRISQKSGIAANGYTSLP